MKTYHHPSKDIEHTSDGVPCFGIYVDGCIDLDESWVETMFVPALYNDKTPFESAEMYWTPGSLTENLRFALERDRFRIIARHLRQVAHTATQIHIQWANLAGSQAHLPKGY